MSILECFRKYNCTKLHVDKKRASLKKILSSILAKRKKWIRSTIWILFQRLFLPTNQSYSPEGRIGCASSLCISFIMTSGRAVREGLSIGMGFQWNQVIGGKICANMLGTPLGTLIFVKESHGTSLWPLQS